MTNHSLVTITSWRTVDFMNPYGEGTVKAAAMLEGRAIGAVIRHGMPHAYIACFGDFTVGTFAKLGEALAAIQAKVQPAAQVDEAPLFIVACSATKRTTTAPVPFIDLYDGPMWRQLRAHQIPAAQVAALSAEHGILAPLSEIETYDRQMDEARAAELGADPHQGAELARLIKAHTTVRAFGGDLYRRVIVTALTGRPDLLARVQFATGSFLKLRQQLGMAIRGTEAPTSTQPDLFTA